MTCATSVLVDLDLRAGVVEGGELLECLRLRVESHDVLDDVSVTVPVEILQVVGRQDVDVARARDARKEDDLLRVPRLEQALHRLHLVTRLRVLLARELVVALPLQNLAHLGEQRVSELLRLRATRAKLRQHALRHLLAQRDVVERAQIERLRGSRRGDEVSRGVGKEMG